MRWRHRSTCTRPRFHPNPFKQARILEFPTYANFTQAFAGTIPYSEGIGLVTRLPDTGAADKIDMVTYVTAHEIAHQWWGHQVIGAEQQGPTLLSETFAQYSALLVMERLYGREQVRKFLKYELDRYLRARGGKLIEDCRWHALKTSLTCTTRRAVWPCTG
jgi:aminopeptidase N